MLSWLPSYMKAQLLMGALMLQGLVNCNLVALPATDALFRVTFLKLDDNALAGLPAAPSSGSSIVALSTSGNQLGSDTRMLTNANLDAVISHTNLEALRISPHGQAPVSHWRPCSRCPEG